MDPQRWKRINKEARERAARKRERDAKIEKPAAKPEIVAAWNPFAGSSKDPFARSLKDPFAGSSKDNICVHLKVMPKREWRLKIQEVMRAWIIELDMDRSMSDGNGVNYYRICCPLNSDGDDLETAPQEWHIFFDTYQPSAPDDVKSAAKIRQTLGRIFSNLHEIIEGEEAWFRIDDAVRFEAIDLQPASSIKGRSEENQLMAQRKYRQMLIEGRP